MLTLPSHTGTPFENATLVLHSEELGKKFGDKRHNLESIPGVFQASELPRYGRRQSSTPQHIEHIVIAIWGDFENFNLADRPGRKLPN